MTATERHVQIVVRDADAGRRLDQVVAMQVDALSRSQAQRLIREGGVTVDGRPAKGSLIVDAGVTVDIRVPAIASAEPAAEALPLTILHDDDDLAVVDKPAGMVVHPAAGHASGTMVNALLHHLDGLSGVGGRERPGVVHRLDKGTSGVMVIAKHDRAHRELSRQFHDREVQKDYLALVWGHPSRGRTFDQPLGRDPRHRQKISSRASRARPATTVVTDVERLDGVSLVRVRIHTGRTHQIRVHLASVGHPVIGDDVYGGGGGRRLAMLPPKRHFLHAAWLQFRHPVSGEALDFRAPLPDDLHRSLAAIAELPTLYDDPDPLTTFGFYRSPPRVEPPGAPHRGNAG